MWRCILILFGLLFLLAGCWTDNPTRHNTFILLTSMEITPTYELMADKTINQYRAVGDFSGAFSRDITSEVTWVIENDAIATVSNDADSRGVVTALAPGETQVTAMYGDLFASAPVIITSAFLTDIGITPQDAELQIGVTQQYEATGTFSDDSVQDITSLATWESSDADIATIDNSGLATALAPGTITMSGTWQGLAASTSLVVADATLTALIITPGAATIAQETTTQFQVEGSYSDGTTRDITDMVNWQSEHSNIGDVDSDGLAEGIAPGETEITASYEVDGETLSASAVLTVTDALIVSISITPEDSIINVGDSQQFTAVGIFSDNSEQDITELATWQVTNNDIGTIDNSTNNRGLFKSSAAGVTPIEATFGDIIGEVILTVQ